MVSMTYAIISFFVSISFTIFLSYVCGLAFYFLLVLFPLGGAIIFLLLALSYNPKKEITGDV
jgi:hypothetical protein